VIEEPLRFGPEKRPLFGWLARPNEPVALGGVLLAPPIGREARGAKRTLRYLALALANRGYVTLRFEYDGTGDSGGAFADPGRDRAWLDSVAHATSLLRSLGPTSVSAVGMRLGATLVGVAAGHDLALTSLVLWDPCESGRSYLRELGALESLRRESFRADPDGSIETAEFVFSRETIEDLRRVNLANVGPGPLAERILVLSREDRAVSDKLRVRLNDEKVEWETTTEQATLLDVEPLAARVPVRTIERIVEWLTAPPSTPTAVSERPGAPAPVVAHEIGQFAVRERFVELGPRRLFGIVAEPDGASRGPWIVLLNVANEDHSGPSRLWVEMSRRWAGRGVRCLRFDVSGVGDSPWHLGDSETSMYARSWLEDVAEVPRAISPDDPSDVVFVGLCSGAFLALEGALSVQARGVCVINPPVSGDLLHLITRLEESRSRLVRSLADRMKQIPLRLRWVAAAMWDVFRRIAPASVTVDLMATVARSGADMLVLASADDVSPFPGIPLLRSIDHYRLFPRQGYTVDFVPDLDHSMHTALGRANAMGRVDRFVLTHYAGETPATDIGIEPAEGS
jgi:esterase/lipase